LLPLHNCRGSEAPLPALTMLRWLKFNCVGIAGAGVQLAALWLLTHAGLHYLLATAVSVEAAVLHNYRWHTVWTWADRPERRTVRCLVRFHLANGFVSLLANVALMRVFSGWLDVPLLPANLAAIALTSVLNFYLGDRWVFTRSGPGTATGG
jgi:dolichol-phosphate mannosyltransferase